MAKEFETIETTATEVETTNVEPMVTDTAITTDVTNNEDEGLSKTAIGLIAGGCVAALTAAVVAGKKLYTKHKDNKAEKQRQKDIVALFDAGKLVAAEEPKEAVEEPKEAVEVEIEPEKEPEKKKK